MIKMTKLNCSCFLLLVCLITSCSVARKIPPGDKLYNGANFTIAHDTGYVVSTRSFKKKLKKIAMPKKNKMILGMPYKVWWWYKIGEPKKLKGFKYWLRTKLGEPPKLGSDLDIKANQENMEAYLDDLGYYRSRVKGDTTVKGYKVEADYKVKIAHPYKIDSVMWLIKDTSLLNKIHKIVNRRSVLKQDDIITLENLKIERNTIDLRLKNRGYYYFNADFLVANVDTSNANYTADILFTIKQETPAKYLRPQRINNIVVFPNYTLLAPAPDTSLANLEQVDGIYIRDTVKQFKSKVFTSAISFRKGNMYSLKTQNKTQNRLINLGVFKFVKNRFEPVFAYDTLDQLNVYYYLTPQKRKAIQTEIGGFSKSNSYLGGQLNVTWRNRNLLRGAENFSIKTYGAYETSLSDSLKHNDNYRLGAEASLVLPKFFLPFVKGEHNLFPPQTRFSTGYEWLRRQALYTKTFLRFQYEINWKPKTNVQHTIAPISMTYNFTNGFTDKYRAEAIQNSLLDIINRPELISGSFYNFLTQTMFPQARNIYYFNGNLDIAGNVLGFINRNKSEPFSNKILGAYYAQYIKADVDFRYSHKISKDIYLANRVMLGASIPYGNSRDLPFSKQFAIGGANSLRGFRPRNLGPGSDVPTANQILYYPQIGGDYKLELNSELRIPIIGALKSAVFVDAGNIWVKDSFLYTGGAVLSKSFVKEIAMDAGLGIRYDATILILRLDLALPLRKPWLPESDRWVFDAIDVSSKSWRRSNLVFNIAIGYPF